MADRNRIADTLQSIADARARNDNDELQRHFAGGAQYRMAVNHHLLAGMSVEAGDAERVVANLVATFRFHDVEQCDLLTEGNKAATRWRVTVSIEGGAPVETELCGIWTFDEDGRVTDLQEFADTAQIMAMFAAMR